MKSFPPPERVLSRSPAPWTIYRLKIRVCVWRARMLARHSFLNTRWPLDDTTYLFALFVFPARSPLFLGEYQQVREESVAERRSADTAALFSVFMTHAFCPPSQVMLPKTVTKHTFVCKSAPITPNRAGNVNSTYTDWAGEGDSSSHLLIFNSHLNHNEPP